MAELPADEYEIYAPRLIALRDAQASDNEIADYLASVESERIGLEPQPRAHLINVVRKIRAEIT